MLSGIAHKIFGTKSERDLKKLQPTLEQINALEGSFEQLSPEALRAKTQAFRDRLADGAGLEDILPEAFAAVREASKRATGMRHFDVQILGGLILHGGKIAEMKTGEGKTLVATLPVYLNALSGRGVHVVTVNDYLAKRDAAWMGPIYEYLGLSVGSVQHDMDNALRKQMYGRDVTYVTNNEIGFDYLRDNMVIHQEDRVLREMHYAIVDEVDSILIDEARTPLIISGPAEESTNKYHIINRITPAMKARFITEKEEVEAKYTGEDLGRGYDAIVDEKAHTATLTDQGAAKCEKMLGVPNLYDDIQSEWVHHITQALRAHHLFKRDVHYVVKDGEVVIVDEFTGRLMPGRRWSDGLHQAVEAKENLRIKEENQTLATITFQNFFKLYKKLAGMTGTAMTEAGEFWEIYKLDCVEIPTNQPMIRGDSPDQIYRTEREKYSTIVGEIEELWKIGRPILVGTRSIEKSEKLSGMLRTKGIPHQVLNAKYHEAEAQIIAQAGKKGTVTIATNMAGRGTDIVLGGNPPDAAEAAYIVEKGGLHVLGTERHESRRIDNQLRGRCGRQGDPGSTRFFLSLEDELMRLFGSDRIAPLMQKLGMQEGEVIEHPWVTRAIENAQRKVEAMNFDIRKQLLEFDNVMNKQREVIYSLRRNTLDGEEVSAQIQSMLEESLEEKLSLWTPPKAHPEFWDTESLTGWLARTFGLAWRASEPDKQSLSHEELKQTLTQQLRQAYENRIQQFGPEMFKDLERMVLLQVLDNAWKNHLYALDHLKKGVGLRAYGQKDPLIEYQRESFNLFEEMLARIREQTVEYIFRIQIPPPERPRPSPLQRAAAAPHASAQGRDSATQTLERPAAQEIPVKRKIGRNDPCLCGSGKKYKKCCGR
ncbi:MAG: preprotein translocase subunit SecA [Elusimicrobia bacterium]|nr:preprotein translocase subunit SecA [Elusimicrobiota bacterium]